MNGKRVRSNNGGLGSRLIWIEGPEEIWRFGKLLGSIRGNVPGGVAPASTAEKRSRRVVRRSQPLGGAARSRPEGAGFFDASLAVGRA